MSEVYFEILFMAHLIQGTATQISKAFGLDWLISKDSNIAQIEQIDLDLPRHQFLGSVEQAKHHIKTWLNVSLEQVQYYSQGDMFAGNLFFFLNPEQPGFPFINKDEEIEQYQTKVRSIGFAFLSEYKELCGLTIFFRNDDPSQWMIGLVKNTNLVPEERTVFIMTSTELKTKGIANTTVSSTKNPLLDQVDSPFLKGFLENIIKHGEGKIDTHCERIELLLRFIEINNGFASEPVNLAEIDPQSLFADNPSLDLAIHYDLKLSPALLKDCLTNPNGLRHELEQQKLTENPVINKNLLKMVIIFHEQQILKENRVFLQEHVFSKVSADFQWDDVQISIIPFLIKNNYDLKLIELILSDEAFYSAVPSLIKLNLTKDISTLIGDAQKLEELKYINGLADLNSRNICLIFWAKGTLSLNDYKAVVAATKDYPLFESTLNDLVHQKDSSIQDLHSLALKPIVHQRLSIAKHFASQLKQYALKVSDLEKLTLVDLKLLIDSFDILIQAGVSDPLIYQSTLDATHQGQLLRLFLPQCSKIKELHNRKDLINIIIVGTHDQISQSKLISKVTDKNVLEVAKEARERMICVKQMQHLGAKEETIVFASTENSQTPNKYPAWNLLLNKCASHLSTKEIKTYLTQDYLSPLSDFRSELEHIPFTDDVSTNLNLLQMAVVFYLEDLLPENRAFLLEHVFSKVSKDFVWNDVQVNVIPYLIKPDYKLEQFKLILSDAVYYNAFNYLIQRGFTQNVPKFLAIPDKIEQLKYINTVKSEHIKKICYVFWAKTELNLDDLKKIVDEIQSNPNVADALIAKDKKQTKTMQQLQLIALNPIERQRLLISHQFKNEFKKHDLKKWQLKHLELPILIDLVSTYDVLRNTNIEKSEPFELALEHSKEGELFRLFVPKLKEVKDLAYREALINIIYTGIKSGSVIQGKSVHAITDKKLLDLAKEVHQRFICAQQLQKLDFKPEIIAFAADEDNPKANRFRQVILDVEEQCEAVHEKFSSSTGKDKDKWQFAGPEYRKTMYDIAYHGLKTPQTNETVLEVKNKINTAEAVILDIVDPKTASWLRKILVVIANILITGLTLGIANDVKLKRTGNYWFFNQTEFGEKFRALDNKVIELVNHSDAALVVPS